MKKNKVIFRADGSTKKGYGHVIRLLSLASMLKKKYFCEFIIQKPDAFLKSQIQTHCDSLIEIPVSTDLSAEARSIKSKYLSPGDIFILDGYNFTTSYQEQIRSKCYKLVCIDDIYDKHFVADVVINHSEGIPAKKYSLESYTKLLLGSEYAILRSSFLEKQKRKERISAPFNVFINMGGTDQRNHSLKALNVCLKNKNVKRVDIVVGSFYAFGDTLKTLSEKNKAVSIKVHSNLSEKEICSLMKKSDCAICSASTVSYEYASVGGPMFIYKTAGNQKNIHSFLLKSEIAFPVKDFDGKMKSFLTQKTLERYYKNRSRYFSGNSEANILSVFNTFEKERTVTIRKAKTSDTLTYHRWVNEKEVRKNSVNQEPISLASHTKWFSKKLTEVSSELYIFEVAGKPLGQVRLDAEDKNAEIDYSIDAAYRGKGWGEIILSKAVAEYRKKHPAHRIIAKVKTANIPSNKVFVKIGFKKTKPVVIQKIPYNRYVLQAPDK